MGLSAFSCAMRCGNKKVDACVVPVNSTLLWEKAKDYRSDNRKPEYCTTRPLLGYFSEEMQKGSDANTTLLQNEGMFALCNLWDNPSVGPQLYCDFARPLLAGLGNYIRLWYGGDVLRWEYLAGLQLLVQDKNAPHIYISTSCVPALNAFALWLKNNGKTCSDKLVIRHQASNGDQDYMAPFQTVRYVLGKQLPKGKRYDLEIWPDASDTGERELERACILAMASH